MDAWSMYKKWFFAWEDATAKLCEQWLQSPAVLEPAGAWLSAMMRMKAAGDRAAAGWWGAVGLPTKRDQERSLHTLNQIHGRLIDLEERLHELESKAAE